MVRLAGVEPATLGLEVGRSGADRCGRARTGTRNLRYFSGHKRAPFRRADLHPYGQPDTKTDTGRAPPKSPAELPCRGPGRRVPCGARRRRTACAHHGGLRLSDPRTREPADRVTLTEGDVPAYRHPVAPSTDRAWQHPWLRIERLIRTMLATRWSRDDWRAVRPEVRNALAERKERVATGRRVRGALERVQQEDERAAARA